LALSSGGTISGTPTTVGAYTFTVQATDSTTGVGGPFTGGQSFTLYVAGYDAATKTLVIVGDNGQNSFTYSQTTPSFGASAPITTHKFSMNGASQSYTDDAVVNVFIDAPGS